MYSVELAHFFWSTRVQIVQEYIRTDIKEDRIITYHLFSSSDINITVVKDMTEDVSEPKVQSFFEKLQERVQKATTLLCIGLDPHKSQVI